MRTRKILILTADAGFGHRSAANAVAAALHERHPEARVDIVNPLDDPRAPILLRESQSDYDRWVREAPELYRWGYVASDNVIPAALMDSALVVMLTDIMVDLLEAVQPDVVLTTYPMYQAPLLSVYAEVRHPVPVYSVITDLISVHRTWFNRRVTGCLVPTNIVAELAMNHGVPPARIHVTGIPVNPKLGKETRSKSELRQALGWQPDIPTVLAVGSRRVERLQDSLAVLNHFGKPLQLAVVTGKDADLYQTLKQEEWHVPTHLYDFVDNMPDLMHAADIILCKAGGLITTESLACGLPMVLIDVIPGQETGNAQYVVENGAGDMAETTLQVLEVFAHLLADDGDLMKQRAEAACALGKPEAAYTVADILWETASKPVRFQHPRRLSDRLAELLLPDDTLLTPDEDKD